MAQIVKSISNKKSTTIYNKVESIHSPSIVLAPNAKGDVHDSPHRSSNNENFLVDYFYEKAHNLKATYLRLNDKDRAKQYYKTHKQEIISGGKDFAKSVNHLLVTSLDIDHTYGTHFRLQIISNIEDLSTRLKSAGFYFRNDLIIYDRRRFVDVFTNDIEQLAFLFQENGLIDRLIKIDYSMLSLGKKTETTGQIIDYHA